MTLLDWVLFLPLIGFLFLIFVPGKNGNLAKQMSLCISLVVFLVSLFLIGDVTSHPAGFSFVQNAEWIHYPPIRYHVGLDGLSLWLVILTTLLTPISILVSWKHIDHRVSEFFAFLILMAPTSSFIPIKDPFVERRIYLSMFGLLLVAIEFLRRLKLSKPVLGATLGTILVVYSAAAWNRNHVWGSAVALWSDTVAKSPNKARPHMQLAYALQYEAGNCQGAVNQYALSAKIEPPDYRALVDAALASDCAGDTTSAIDFLKKAAAMEHSAHAYSQLGMMFAKAGRTSEALNALSEAERLDAGFDMTYAYRGNIFLTMEDRPQAIEQFQKALAFNSKNEMAKTGLAQAQVPPPKPASK